MEVKINIFSKNILISIWQVTKNAKNQYLAIFLYLMGDQLVGAQKNNLLLFYYFSKLNILP